jgi:hypothetical protein
MGSKNVFDIPFGNFVKNIKFFPKTSQTSNFFAKKTFPKLNFFTSLINNYSGFCLLYGPVRCAHPYILMLKNGENRRKTSYLIDLHKKKQK